MEGYYYGILRKYTEELKLTQALKDHSSTSSSNTISSSSSTSSSTSSSDTKPASSSATSSYSPNSSSSLEIYNQTTPLLCNQTNSITSYNTMYNHI